MKAETVEQFYILKWIEANFEISLLEIKLVDRHTVKIRDSDGKTARVTYVGKDDIQLFDDTTYGTVRKNQDIKKSPHGAPRYIIPK